MRSSHAFAFAILLLLGAIGFWLSGLGAEQWGYGAYFALTFLASLPGLCLVPLVASWLPTRSEGRPAA